MVDEVYYFGYGANRDSDMIKALLGRVPESYSSRVYGVELMIQSWEDIPEKIKSYLKPAWNNSFKTYFIKPSSNSKSVVSGKIWKISRKERKIMDYWEGIPAWYDSIVTQYKDTNSKIIQTEIPVISNFNGGVKVNGINYKSYLNNKAKMLKIAKKVNKFALKQIESSSSFISILK